MGWFANSTRVSRHSEEDHTNGCTPRCLPEGSMWFEWADLTRGLIVAGAIWAVYPLFYWYSRKDK